MYAYNKLYSHYKKLYPKYLKRLTLVLNDCHQKQFNEEYWESIIGLYLRRFIINYLFSRKSRKRKLQKKIELKKIEFFKSYSEFANNIDYKKINYEYFFIQNKFKDFNNFKLKKINFFNKISNTIITFLPNILVRFGVTKIFFQESYFKKKLKNLFSLNSIFFINSLPSLNVENYKVDKKKIFVNRMNMIKKYRIYDPKDFLFQNLIFSMPINYIENYSVILNEVKKINLVNALYIDGNEVKFDFIKFYISELKIKKKKIITGQHSLRSGIQDFDTYFDYSKSISDYFLTWGWSDKFKSIVSYSSTRIFSSLNKFKRVEKIENLRNDICFILCSFSEYGECLYDNFFENKKAENQRIDLLKNLKKLKNFNIILKPREGSFLIKKKSSFYKNLKVLRDKTRMYEIFGNYKVIIFERLSLGIVESMYLNQPVVFYYPKNLYKQKNKKYIELLTSLKKANIFFDNKENFLRLLKSKKNIDSWWNSKNNVKNREKFLKKFANCFNYKDFDKLKKLI